MTRLCAVLPSEELIGEAKEADMVEIRTDIFREMPRISGKETIVALRGGSFSIPGDYRGYIDSEDPLCGCGNRIIASVHDYEKTPSAERIISVLSSKKGDIVKGAYTVRSFADLNAVFAAARGINRPHILIGMGEIGKITRVRSELLGNEISYCHLGTPSAEGQYSLRESLGFDGNTTVLGIVGNPLSSSKSERMHTAAIEKRNLNAVYLKFEVPDLNGLAETVINYGIRGLNVTIPYKTEIIGRLDALDSAAEEIGAVNTVVNDSGKLRGFNTDIDGMRKAFSLRNAVPSGKALVMGSGGTARTAIKYLRDSGCEIHVSSRNPSGITEFCRTTQSSVYSGENIGDFDVIANCTPMGMYAPAAYPFELDDITNKHIVFDAVYGTKTPLTEAAERAGAVTVCGEDMLAGQGSASFALWTGIENTFEIMRGAV